MKPTKAFKNPFPSPDASSPASDPGPVAVLDAPPAAGPGEFRIIRVDEIRESDTNPRRVFAAGPMNDLIASVKESGVHVPIVVRPIHGDRVPANSYELVAGARRLRAAKAAGLAEIPALIREMTDVQVLELQVIENNQREDVHPIEEGQAIASLMCRGVDLPTIAHKIGRHLTYVTKRLQLCHLDRYFQDLWIEKAAIGVEQALIIARLSPAQQKILRDSCKRMSWMVDRLHETRWLRDHLAETFERELAGVAWKLDDAELLPKAGSCKTCSKRTGAQSALFDDVKKDTCLDPECFDKKRDAFVQLQISALKDKKVKPVLVSCDHGKKQPGVVSRWEVDEITPAAAKKLKPDEVRTAIRVDGDDAGKTMLIKVSKASRAARPGISDAEKRKREKMRQEQAFNEHLLGAVIQKGQVLSVDASRIIALKLFERLWDDTRHLVAKRHGWEKPKNAGYNDWRLKLATNHLNSLDSTAAVAAFAIECALIGLVKVDPNSLKDDAKRLAAAAKDLGVDVEAERKAFNSAGETPAEPVIKASKSKAKVKR